MPRLSPLFRTAALAALLAVPGGAFAQSDPQTDDGTAPLAEDGTAPAEIAEAAPEPPKPVEGQIVLQSENTILAQDLLGSRVYTSSGESIGAIDDMIVTLDGTVEGIVIGVGGFLGMGKKAVALQMASLSTSTDESGNVRLVTTATETDLDAADPFVTAAQQRAIIENQQAVETQGGDGTGG